MSKKHRITVLGAGSWGTTLAILLDENGHEVRLWEFDAAQAELLERERVNQKFLPGIPISRGIRIGNDLGACLTGSDIVVFVVPSHAVRSVAVAVRESGVEAGVIVVNAAKGLEEQTLKRMSEVLDDELPIDPSRICTVSGPSHAEEVSQRMPTSVVAAGIDTQIIECVQDIFFSPYFRVYTNTDLVGVEIGVALKNAIAIAAGVCDGLGYGDNTKAALLTRGLVEITRLGTALGGRRETFFGLAGIGDLVATGLSRHSRNRYVGERIGMGESLEDVLSHMVMVAEGVRTTRAAVEMARRHGVQLPIIESVHEVLFSAKEPREAINDLMNRPPQRETNWVTSSTKGGHRP